MNQKEKLRVLLEHWIDHNKGHEAECSKWIEVSKEEGMGDVAASIEQAVTEMNKVGSLLEKALEQAGGKLEKQDGSHHHHHHHHH